jgi:hypothetical protein
MANICKLCAHPDQEMVRAAFASGATDRELARQFGISHMAIGRHRRAHIVGPLKAAVAALDKGRTERAQRTQQLTAIEQGDPTAIVAATLGMEAQIAKLERIEQRLERMATAAEKDRSSTGVAVLSAQQLRGIETGAKLAGVGGFAPRSAESTTPGEKFSIVIRLGDKTQTITTVAGAQPPVIEQEADRRDEGDEWERP